MTAFQGGVMVGRGRRGFIPGGAALFLPAKPRGPGGGEGRVGGATEEGWMAAGCLCQGYAPAHVETRPRAEDSFDQLQGPCVGTWTL